jgi:hypothetical protein
MNNHRLLSTLLAFSLPILAFGADDAARPDIDELLTISRVQKMSDSVMDQVKAGMAAVAKQAGSSGAAAGNQKKMQDDMFDFIKSEMSWDKMKVEYGKMYAEVFTPDEIKQLIAFYKTPTGQMFLDKQPLLVQKSMAMGQNMMIGLMPKIQEMVREEQNGTWKGTLANDEISGPLSGKYLLVEHPKDVQAPDLLDFHPDGSCVVDLGVHTGIAGKYQTDDTGNLTLQPAGNPEFKYHFQRLKTSIILTPDSGSPLYYGLKPDQPTPVAFTDAIGTYLARDQYGDSVTQITPDHKFLIHGHQFDNDGHVYYDIRLDGTCSFADGVITYNIAHSVSTQQDQYVRDLLVKHDDKGLWVVDAYTDAILCETPSKDLDLPPPPEGYREGTITPPSN